MEVKKMRPKYMEYSTKTSNRGTKKRREKVNIETRKDNKSKPPAGEGEKAWFRANKLLMNCKLCLQKHKNFSLQKVNIKQDGIEPKLPICPF